MINSKETILLLHGAIGSAKQLEPLKNILSENFNAHSIDFSGHGGKAIPYDPFSIELFSNDVLQWMRENNLQQINIFGYSMGGYVGLYLAKHHPAKVKRLFTLATKLKWNEEIALKESKMLNAEKIKEKIPHFANELEARHAPQDWKKVLSKTAEMMLDMGRKNPVTDSDFATIEHPVLLALGDSDIMVTPEETLYAYRTLKNAQLLILPSTPHPIEKVSVHRITMEAQQFLIFKCCLPFCFF